MSKSRNVSKTKVKFPVRIGFDATWLASTSKTGIGFYTQNLVDSLARVYPDQLRLTGHYFSRYVSLKLAETPNIKYKQSRLIPLKLVNLLRRVGLEIPIEFVMRKRSDFLLFPSYTSYPTILNTPSAVVIHDLAYIDMPDTVSDRNRRDLIRNVPKSIARASFIITISEWTKQRIIEVYKTDKPILITNIPPVVRNLNNDPETIVKKLGINKKFILYLGTIEPRKNITGLLEAYSKLPEDMRNKYSLVLAGMKGWKDSEIRLKIEQLNGEGIEIIETGYVTSEQRDALFKSCTLYVLVSFYEGFGMTLLEAMTYAKPVVASNIPVFHEVCGSAAAYCEPGNSKDISTTIEHLLKEEAERNKLVISGTENLKRFSWDKVAQDLYSQIETTLALKK